MAHIIEMLDEIANSDEQSVLATIIHVEGSAYQKEGTSMLFSANGKQIGIISAGCLETDLAIRATELMQTSSVQNQTFVYDTSAEDDLSWGRGAGCNGKIHILLEKVNSINYKDLLTLRVYLHQGIPVVAMKIFEKDPSSVRTLYVSKDQHMFGHRDAMSHQLNKIARHANKSRLQYMENLGSHIFIHRFEPQPRLFIFGAGPDVIPLAAVAAKTNFKVIIWDWRLARLNKMDFPDANFIKTPSIPEMVKELDFWPTDSIMIMTHDFQKDKELLASLSSQQVNYFGILGPRKRTSRLLHGKNIPEHVHSPAGLAIGAKGPEEIAISIVADMVQVKREKSYEKRLAGDTRRNSSHLSSSRQKQTFWQE
ncbi:XdhC family protein [Lentibacillus daqui]|uniref:XdhC family protein n=1 Tax=Lentibacillus daqui TaxID=2911514 RepID=UPI0022B0AC0A|nr:XdhC family protein [Lentibacillus daqui]